VLTRRYSAALAQASSLFDLEIPHAQAMAQQCGEYPGFNETARRRLGVLADNLTGVEQAWREWRWLAGRSQRNALAFLGLVERP
jgi:hypothetical protein